MNNIKYIMRTESADEYIIEDIDEVLNSLNWLEGNETSFITVSSQPFVQKVVFMQTCCNIDDKTEVDVYAIEVQTQDTNGVLTQYRLETEDLGVVKKLFVDYIKTQRIADLSTWSDITFENPHISQKNAKILNTLSRNPEQSVERTKAESKLKLPPAIHMIYTKRKMDDHSFFAMLNALDWSKNGNDESVLEPLIKYLSQWPDEIVFAFDDKMTELLYGLDNVVLAKTLYGERRFSGDEFLYVRCAALLNGKAYYYAVLNGRKKLKELEFEAILYAPAKAWARKHNKEIDDYPHRTELSYETGSNKDLWRNL